MTMFRAIWPITDESVSWADLVRQARGDLPALVAQARAMICGPGRFSMAPSEDVPGSGRTTRTVLVYEAPANAVARRAYHKGPTVRRAA